MGWPYHSFNCVLLYYIAQLDFQIVLKEFGDDWLEYKKKKNYLTQIDKFLIAYNFNRSDKVL